MNFRDLKLIALQQAITLYKHKEINVRESTVDISAITKQLMNGTSFNDNDSDIDVVNIENTIEEPDVTIINQTVECDEHHKTTESTEDLNKEPITETPQIQPNSITNTETGIKGRLFQYFKGDNNAEK